tara:strand:- start:953 stop:1936 length:984 start_codon:yes stop_codon:yes gene_type:complete
MQKNVLHIGFPKTGTTTLQNNFFPKHPEIHCLGKPFSSYRVEQAVTRDLFNQRLDFSIDEAKDVIVEEMAKIRNDQKVNLLSYEGFTSLLEDYKPEQPHLVDRLFDIFGVGSKVVIVIRNQKNFFNSIYMDTVLAGSYISFPHFAQFFINNISRTFMQTIKYVPLIKYYCKVFGEENVWVTCYESMLEDAISFLDEFCRFVGVSSLRVNLPFENISLGRMAINLRRILNRIIKFDYGRPPFYMPINLRGESKKNWRGTYKRVTKKLTYSVNPYLPFNQKLEFPRHLEKKFDSIFGPFNRTLMHDYSLKLDTFDYPGIKRVTKPDFQS